MGNCWRFLNHWQVKDLTCFRLAARRLHLQINMTILTYFSNTYIGLISLHLHLNILLSVPNRIPELPSKVGCSYSLQRMVTTSFVGIMHDSFVHLLCLQILLSLHQRVTRFLIFITSIMCVCAHMHSVTQSCTIFWDPMDWSPPGSSVHEIFH